jgi:hypothetical protein
VGATRSSRSPRETKRDNLAEVMVRVFIDVGESVRVDVETDERVESLKARP